jgi:hypothetical protein
MKDPTSQLRSATKRAKSDVANKVVSMCLHELSRRIAEHWKFRIDGEEYEKLVREWFNNNCPYCSRPLADGQQVIEHLDGMNRYRAGLHVAGNVLVACKTCNGEKRRDDSAKTLSLAESGWASFLSHDGTRCASSCLTCRYWGSIWKDETERGTRLRENSERIRSFRASFPELEQILPAIRDALPELLSKLYSDCQSFAEKEIRTLLEGLDQIAGSYMPKDSKRATGGRTRRQGKVEPLNNGPAAGAP